jgi:hypothetical protein
LQVDLDTEDINLETLPRFQRASFYAQRLLTLAIWLGGLALVMLLVTGLNLRVSPNDGLQLLALAVMLAPPLDNPQEFSVFGQKRHQVVTFAALHGTTIVV